jgi:hypothetical protein
VKKISNSLTNAPILKVANLDDDLVVCTNACNKRIGGVLMQNRHVICYESRKLKEHKINYATHDLEFASIVHALKIWRHYVMSKKFELRTNHSGVKYLFQQRTLNSRENRWLEFLRE